MQKGFIQHHLFLKIKNSTKSSAGFTLIEMLVYLALFAIIIGGGVVTVYQIIQNSNSLQAKVILEEEGNFIMAKLNWALTGAQANTIIESPGLGISSSTLIIKTLPGNILQFEKNGDFITLGDGVATNSPKLNSDRIIVSSLNFIQPVAGEIQASTTLTTTSNDGKEFSQTFEITKYLRR